MSISMLNQEYEDDPRQEFLGSYLTCRQSAPLSPLAGALQGVQPLLALFLKSRLQDQHNKRKADYSAAATKALEGLPEGAGLRDVAHAYATSGNADLATDSTDLLVKAITGRTAAKYATTKGFDAQNRPYVTSDTGEVLYLDATREPERQIPIALGNRYVFRGDRSGAITPAEGLGIGVSPTAVYSADQRASEGAANRAQRAELAAARASRAGQRPAKPSEFDVNMERAGIEPGSEQYRKAARIKAGLETRPGGLMDLLMPGQLPQAVEGDEPSGGAMPGESAGTAGQSPAPGGLSVRLEQTLGPDTARALRKGISALPAEKQHQALGVARRLAQGRITKDAAAQELEELGL